MYAVIRRRDTDETRFFLAERRTRPLDAFANRYQLETNVTRFCNERCALPKGNRRNSLASASIPRSRLQVNFYLKK